MILEKTKRNQVTLRAHGKG